MESRQFENAEFFRLVELELKECGKVHFKVKGFSMQPIIRNGRDSVLLYAYKGEDLKHGDICLFRFHGACILHRYKRDEGGYMIMQGDNIIVSHEFCKKEDVLGVVRTVIHDGKEISPTSFKWKIITSLHRFYLRCRMFAGNVLRKLGLR